ncbi:hypothetical protein DPMN_086320, partial [Dreissena polymorpha]
HIDEDCGAETQKLAPVIGGKACLSRGVRGQTGIALRMPYTVPHVWGMHGRRQTLHP